MKNTVKWRSRKELPLFQKLNLKFDPEKLLEAYSRFEKGHQWDGLGSEYMNLCETHTRLPKMFFTKEELEGADNICDMDWQNVSYQQLSLTQWDDTFSLEKRTEQSQTAWDHRIAKGKPEADERWYRKRYDDLPQYFHEVLNTLGGNKTHRARFAKLLPHSIIKPHIDYDTTYGIRLNIPIVTNENCFFGGLTASGENQKFHMPADGSVFFINPGLKHWASNEGESERVHLIISVDSHELIQNI